MLKCPYCIHSNPPGVDHCQYCGALTTDPKPPNDASPTDEMRSLVAQGKKIEAIKMYREQKGVGLKEAKDAVEALERGANMPSPTIDKSLDQEVLSLVQRGEKIQAIKLYRERAGISLKEAKEAVESMAGQHGIVPRIRVVLLVLLAILGLAGIVFSLFR